jgi:micrococcal nuclease
MRTIIPLILLLGLFILMNGCVVAETSTINCDLLSLEKCTQGIKQKSHTVLALENGRIEWQFSPQGGMYQNNEIIVYRRADGTLKCKNESLVAVETDCIESQVLRLMNLGAKEPEPEVSDNQMQKRSKVVSPQPVVSKPAEKPRKRCELGYQDEYKCFDDELKQKYQNSDCTYDWFFEDLCYYGCQNKKCKPCSDSDGGRDYSTKGYIYYGGQGKVYDECIKDSNPGEYEFLDDHLTEFYCENGRMESELYECPASCNEGACDLQIGENAVSGTVIDGDTIKLSTGETVRLIGLNSPETGQSCSAEATDKLKELIRGKDITLEEDLDRQDHYGRLLRYVYADGTFVNMEMVRLGFAHKYEYGYNTEYSSDFEQAENEAKQNGGCLWKKSDKNYVQDECFIITRFHYNAEGDDNYNLHNEYVVLRNTCSYSITMDGWTIKDETSSHVYTFPAFEVGPDGHFALHSGTGTDGGSKLYWGREEGSYAAIWNNDGDTLFLGDADGNLVLSESY